MIKEAISKVVEKQDLTEAEAQTVMAEVMRGEATQAQIAALIVALRMKGETTPEIVGCARAMRSSALKVSTQRQPLVDTCGTGGDNAGTFNISTIASLVLAGAGVAIAKHGNRSVSSRSGSADVLDALGVAIDLGPEAAGRCLDEIGVAFLFAQRLHPAMKNAAAPRREIGVRTIFNILGPLANPAGAPIQVMGVFSAALTEKMAQVLASLGSHEAMVVNGDDCLDELSTTGRNRVSHLRQGKIATYELDAMELGLPRASRDDLRGGTPQQNASIALDVLRGQTGPKRDIVLLNAAAGMLVSGRADSMASGLSMAAQSIDSGRAIQKLEQLIAVSRRLSGSAA